MKSFHSLAGNLKSGDSLQGTARLIAWNDSRHSNDDDHLFRFVSFQLLTEQIKLPHTFLQSFPINRQRAFSTSKILWMKANTLPKQAGELLKYFFMEIIFLLFRVSWEDAGHVTGERCSVLIPIAFLHIPGEWRRGINFECEGKNNKSF